MSREPLKITVEASLNAEMDDHIGYAKHSLDGYNSLLPVTRMPSTSSWVFCPSLGETLTCSVRLNLLRQPQKSTLRRLPHDVTPLITGASIERRGGYLVDEKTFTFSRGWTKIAYTDYQYVTSIAHKDTFNACQH
ncbi:MAG: hypothetical protein Q7W13_15605 [Bacteroidia bacterium]|nr:hypothetical protein [Bacteroidia bacterium]